MKNLGLFLIVAGVLVLLAYAAREVLKELLNVPLAIQVGLGLLVIGFVILIITLLVDKSKSGGE